MRGSRGCTELKAEIDEPRAQLHGGLLIGIAHGEERRSALRKRSARGALGLGDRRGEVRGARHHLAGGAHLRPEHRVSAREAGEQEDGRLDRHVAVRVAGLELQVGEAGSAASRHAASTRFTPIALLAKGTVRDAREFASRT